MKFLLLSAVAASLFFAAAAVTFTTYTDAACGTPHATSDSAPNPVVAKLNECTKYMTSGSSTIYAKPTSCGAKAAGATYSDDKCATKIQDIDSETDKCLPQTGGSSLKVTCAPASSISIALFTVLAAMLALF
jgi:hypothetical protein